MRLQDRAEVQIKHGFIVCGGNVAAACHAEAGGKVGVFDCIAECAPLQLNGCDQTEKNGEATSGTISAMVCDETLSWSRMFL